MITKLGREIVETQPPEKTLGQSLGVGLAAGALGRTGAMAAIMPAALPLAGKALMSGHELTRAESERLIRIMLGNRGDISVREPVIPIFDPSRFEPRTKTVVAPKDSYVLAHELGHATGLMGKNRILGQLGPLFTHGLGGPLLAPIITSVNSAQKAYNREIGLSRGEDSKALDVLNTAAQIGTAGQLAEEAQASIRGINAIGKIQGRGGMLHAAKVFGPAFGTYALGALASHGIAPWIGGKIGKAMGKYRGEHERKKEKPMITKTGAKMVKEAVVGAITGAVRANNLTAEQRRTLEQEYGLDEGASLGWRNAGRGFLGGFIGAMPGRLAMRAGGEKIVQEIAANVVRRAAGMKEVPITMATKALLGLGAAGSAIGGITGIKWGTNKYSVGNAERIMSRNQKPDVPLAQISERIGQYGLDGDAARGVLAFYAENPNARKDAF